MAAAKLNTKVRPFKAASTAGGEFSLADAKGQTLVLYFYPKDMTSGCSVEARDFRDLYGRLRRNGVLVLGVSRDSLKSHEKFREKESLPFHLLSDPDEKLCRQFDVIREKSLYGRKFLGIERSTFVIDGQGVLRHEWRKVKVTGHAQEVFDAIRDLG